MISFTETRGFANKSKPLTRRKFRQVGSVLAGVVMSGRILKEEIGLLTFEEFHRDGSLAHVFPNPMTKLIIWDLRMKGNVPVGSMPLISVTLARGPFRKRWTSAGSNDNRRLHLLFGLKQHY